MAERALGIPDSAAVENFTGCARDQAVRRAGGYGSRSDHHTGQDDPRMRRTRGSSNDRVTRRWNSKTSEDGFAATAAAAAAVGVTVVLAAAALFFREQAYAESE